MKAMDIFKPIQVQKQRHNSQQVLQARRRVNKFFEGLETRSSMVNDKVVLVVYNRDYPEKSYILTEPL